MKNLVRLFAALAATGLFVADTNAAQTNCTILLRAIDSGYYDRYGERDTRIKEAVAGFSALSHVRGPFRSFIAFDIPDFPGTATSASLLADVYSISPDGSETLQLWSVTSPIPAVRNGGVDLTGIYTDLGDGVPYGNVAFPSGYHYGENIPLAPNAVAAVNDAKGEEFALGGRLANANSAPIYNELVDLLSPSPDRIVLRLEASVPVEPIIFTQPPGRGPIIYSNAAFFTVGACGAPPLEYYWFVDGVTDGPRSQPDFYIPFLATNQQSVFVVVSNTFGTATSIVSQAHSMPARFNPQSTNITVRVGDHFSINPGLALFSTVAVEWRKNGAPLPPGQWYSYEINGAQLSDAGDYTIVVNNSFGTVTSAVMRLQVVETPPLFWREPFDQNAAYGEFVSLSAEVRAGPPATLRWYRVGSTTPVVGATDALYISSLTDEEAGQYYVVASNYLGMATSQVATVTAFLDPPVFTVQPQSQVAYPGSTVRLEGRADGQPFVVYQWYFNGAPIFERAPQLWLFNVSSNEAGTYYLVATNASGAATSQVAIVTVPYVPPVLSGPDDATIGEGNSVSLTLLVSNPPVHVRWQHNGTNIPGSDSGVSLFSPPQYVNFFINASDTNKAGLYSAIVSNAYGFSTSRVAMLTVVSSPPFVALNPSVRSVLEGSKVEFFVVMAGAPPPQVALYRDGTNTGALFGNQRFTLPAVALADSGNYFAIASNRIGMATSQVSRLDVQRAGPLDRWNVRSPLPQGNDLFAVAFGGGKFVAVGRNGALISSADGTNWNTHGLPTSAELNDVTYGDGRFVAVGEESLLLTSTNGENWTRVPMDPGLEFSAAAYGGGSFIVVGRPSFVASPKVFTSTNGVNWVDATFLTPSANWLRTVAYGANTSAAIDAGGQVLRSADFAHWIATPNNFYNVEALKFLQSGFFAVGNQGFLAKSPNGVTWTTNYITPLRLYDVTYGQNQYVAVGARGFITRSSDGNSWSELLPPTPNRLEGIIYGNDLFVAVGERGTILTSNDGESWMNQIRTTGEDLDGLAVGGRVAVAVGKNDTILTSLNGRDWTRANVPSATNNALRDWHGVGYGDGKFVAVGQTKDILVSTNGVDWELYYYETPLAPYLKSVAYGAGVWVAVGEHGQLFSSTDAALWLPFDSTVPYDLNEVAYGNGMFVAVGDRYPDPDATILTSTNGTNWFNRSIATGKNTRGIAFANGRFVVVMNDGRVMHGANPDLYDWTSIITPVAGQGNNLRGVTWSNGLWVAVGNEGLILTSTNAVEWKRRVAPTEENLHGVRYFNGTFIAVGNAGTILQSDPLITQLAAEIAGADLRLTLSSPYEGVLKLQYADEFMPLTPPANPWQDLAFVTNVAGTVHFAVPLPPGAGHKFYRAVAP